MSAIPHHGLQRPARGGHYESWFLRANHPSEPRAFWIRYTLFVPEAPGRAALGELWAVHFDGVRERIVAVKREEPLAECRFAREHMQAAIGDARLESHRAEGRAASGGHRIAWRLGYGEGAAPLRLLPRALYGAPFPKAKSVTSRPQVRFEGALEVDGERVDVDGWTGSENHNWGSEHTSQYAWGQVVGFDDAPDALLECATARVKLGPVPTPWLTIACLRLDGAEHRFDRVTTALRARGGYTFFDWHFRTAARGAALEVRMAAPREAFTGLTYYNPPGGSRTCLNTKIARCEATLVLPDGSRRALSTAHRAAFEILTERGDHGVPVAV